MRTKTETRQIVAEILREIRTEAGWSKARMADRLNVGERTYARYEAGDSSPTLPEFLDMLDAVDAPALSVIMRHIYPESYEPKTGTAAARQALASFIMNDMSDRGVRQLLYILQGPHGSSVEAQLQLFTALDHMPMDIRLAVAKLALNAWEITSARDNVINPEYTGPDIELLRHAIIKAHEAVIAGRNNYSTT